MIKKAATRFPVAVVVAFSLAAMGLAVLLAGSPAVPFARFFGAIDPVPATGIVVLAAAAAHWHLQSRGVFYLFRPGRARRGLYFAAILAPLFAVPTILADILIGFPRDINAPVPEALLFYPLMGYVAETAFHLVPLSVLVVLAQIVSRGKPGHRSIWTVIGVVALVEPVFQVSGTFGVDSVWSLDVYVLIHLTVFSIVLLELYRRFDFVTAFAFRLAYYLCWHIIWGVMRLQLLF
jgi:hypothetical protein